MASISFRNVTKIYDGADKPVVPNLNLEIADKEFIILVGPSGCGKSTTLRMIAGLESISSGELYIGDRLVNNVPPKDRDSAMVFQNYALYPHMSVYKNIAFGLTLRNVPKDEIDKRVHEAAKILDLEHLLERKPKALSGGQRQRVALGRAMVRNPAVFLLDEPLSNLVAKLRTSMRSEIARLHRRLDTTFVYVTHDQTEAMTMGDRIVVMKDGLIQQYDTPKVLYDTPCNLFVAGFIGSPQMNFLKAKLVKEAGGKYSAQLYGLSVPLDEEKCAKLAAKNIGSQDVTLGIRPEHTQLVFDGRDGTIEGTLRVNEMMGSELHLHVNLNDGTQVILRIPTLDLTEEQRAGLTYGSKLWFTFPEKVTHLFDPETEESLLF